MSTDGLKAELVNRLQARLDEEEFGLAEAPPAEDPPAKEPTDAPVEEAAPSKEDPPAQEEVKVVAVADEAADATTESEAKQPAASLPDEKAVADSKSIADALKEAPVSAKITPGMSFEEKRRARAARFGMPVVDSTADKRKGDQTRNQRKRKGKGGRGDDRGKAKPGRGGEKRQKTEAEKKDTNVFESLPKEELEKRLERAKKYNLANNTVDAMKAALRKHRFD